jgi:hypothetical protein
MRTIRFLIGLAALLASFAAGAGQFSLYLYPVSVNESAGTLDISVLYVGNDGTSASVGVTTFDITAIAGTHYGTPGVAAPVTTTLTWGPFENGYKTFSIPIINDGGINADRKVGIRLQDPVNGIIVDPDAMAVAIVSNDVVLGFETNAIRFSRAANSVTLQLPCSGVVPGTIATWSTIDGTALAGRDFGYRTGSISRCHEGSAGPLTIPIQPGVGLVGDRSFTVVITPSNPDAVPGPYFHAITVTLGDGQSVGFDGIAPWVQETASLTFVPVSLSFAAPYPVSVRWTTGGGYDETAIPGTHYGTPGSTAQVTGTLSWAAGESGPRFITIGPGGLIETIPNGVIDDSTRRFGVHLSNLTPGVAYGTTLNDFIIQEGDTNFILEGPYNTANETGTFNTSMHVTRRGSSQNAGSVSWITVNGTAIAGTDFGTPGSTADLSGTLTFMPGESPCRPPGPTSPSSTTTSQRRTRPSTSSSSTPWVATSAPAAWRRSTSGATTAASACRMPPSSSPDG